MFATFLSGKKATDDRLRLIHLGEVPMHTFNAMPINWQWLISEII
jgi:hypothetical protein